MKSNQSLAFDKSWTLFLDRDGVINRRLVDDYVKSVDEFELLPELPEMIAVCSHVFGRIVVVSNQQGIGKGLMNVETLEEIHRFMKEKIKQAGGRIDAVYYCPYLKQQKSILRKPNIGMGLLAKKDFPEIRFKKSLMVGDSMSDMEFGKKLKMTTVFISAHLKDVRENPKLIDYHFDSVKSMVENLIQR